MKKLLLIFMLATTLACQVNSGGNVTETVSNLRYFRDPNTNLCFAQVANVNGYGNVVSIACVPCDSIPKNLLSY